LGFPNQFPGLNVARRLSKSPLSQGLQEGCDDPRAEPPALVLKDARGGCVPTQDCEPVLEPGPWPNQSAPPKFEGTAGDDAPAEL